jgi:hypothetical protein
VSESTPSELLDKLRASLAVAELVHNFDAVGGSKGAGMHDLNLSVAERSRSVNVAPPLCPLLHASASPLCPTTLPHPSALLLCTTHVPPLCPTSLTQTLTITHSLHTLQPSLRTSISIRAKVLYESMGGRFSGAVSRKVHQP